METAIITNVQRGSLHDGPDVRTTFFFQGCNLHCATTLKQFRGNRCIGYRTCEDECLIE